MDELGIRFMLGSCLARPNLRSLAEVHFRGSSWWYSYTRSLTESSDSISERSGRAVLLDNISSPSEHILSSLSPLSRVHPVQSACRRLPRLGRLRPLRL